MKRGALLVRADSTVASGTGHVMRCLALAQAWQRGGGNVIFAMSRCALSLRERLHRERIEVVDIEAEPGSDDDLRKTVVAVDLHLAHAEWIVVDGYHFRPKYLSELQKNNRILLIDDNAELDFYPADLVLNQNPHARPEMYANRESRTRVLLGPRYALLRNEFAVCRNWNRRVPTRASKALLTVGGSDPKNLTPRILSALATLPVEELQIRVVVGGSAENLKAVEAAAAENNDGRIEVLSNVSNMAELMTWADLAVAGAGTTCWEMCLLGLPAVLIVVAENQRRLAEYLSTIGAAGACDAESLDIASLQQLTCELLANQDRRREMSQAGRQLVDGLGRERVDAALLNRELHLRLAQAADCELVFEWARDPIARAASFHSSEISSEEHARWFADKLQDLNSPIYIGENSDGEPVGLVRFQIKNDTAVLSVNVAPAYRGEGWGRQLVQFGTSALFRARSVCRIHAFVKPGNQASVRLFEASGFQRAAPQQVAGQDAFLFILEGNVLEREVMENEILASKGLENEKLSHAE